MNTDIYICIRNTETEIERVERGLDIRTCLKVLGFTGMVSGVL